MKRAIALFLMVTIIMSQLTISTFAGEKLVGFYIKYDGKVHQYLDRTVKLNIDGSDLATGEMPAIIIDGRTLVPAREVFESNTFGAKVEWNGKSNEVYIEYKENKITLKIGSTTAYVNGEPIKLDVPANLIQDTSKANAKTMIPLRFVTENLGYGVVWEGSTYTAKITSPPSQEDQKPEEEPIEDHIIKDNKILPTPLKSNPIIWGASIQSDEEVMKPDSITPQNNKDVDITEIEYIKEKNTFNIKANGPMSSVEETIWDGKYIIEITGGKYAFDGNDLYQKKYADSSMVSEVRSSQKQDKDGRNLLRIVFDLKNSDEIYHLSMSEDRKTLLFTMQEIELQRVELNQNEKGDYILLTGSVAPEINSFRLTNPNRIIFDLPYTKSLISHQTQENALGEYISVIRTSPYEKTTTRVVVETDGQPDYTIKKIDHQTVMIQFMKPSYKNIEYENKKNPLIILENAADKINLEKVTYEDRYMEREFVIHLPGNYEALFGYGNIHVDDSNIKNIEIKKDSLGNTSLVIHGKSIFIYKLEADQKDIVIKGYKPKEIYSQILVLDIGHGGSDPGATRNGYQEKDINLEMGLFLKEYLDADASIKVYYPRTTDIFIPLQGRTDLANDVEADFVISLHNNAFNPESNGTETIYFKDQDRPGLNSVELASIVQKNVLKAVGLKNRGIKPDNGLFILRNSKMPAAIVEVGFVSSKIDIVKITDKKIQKDVGKAIYDSILEVFKTYPTGR